jgi:hypothetical protein
MKTKKPCFSDLTQGLEAFLKGSGTYVIHFCTDVIDQHKCD